MFYQSNYIIVQSSEFVNGYLRIFLISTSCTNCIFLFYEYLTITIPENNKKTLVAIFLLQSGLDIFSFVFLILNFSYLPVYIFPINSCKKCFAAPTADASFLYEQFFRYLRSWSNPLYCITFSPRGTM